MQVSVEGTLQQLGPHLIEFPSNNLAYSQVGSAGITHLSKAQWRSMNKIELSFLRYYSDSNCLRVDGAKQLIRANWPKLSGI